MDQRAHWLMKPRTCYDASQPQTLAWRQSDTPPLPSHGSSGAWWCLLKKGELLGQEEQQACAPAPELITDLFKNQPLPFIKCSQRVQVFHPGQRSAPPPKDRISHNPDWPQTHYVEKDDMRGNTWLFQKTGELGRQLSNLEDALLLRGIRAIPQRVAKGPFPHHCLQTFIC